MESLGWAFASKDGRCNATFSGDPRLGPLQFHGGTTPTHPLLPGSLAIDAGDADGVAVCDIGAYEAFWTFTQYLAAIWQP